LKSAKNIFDQYRDATKSKTYKTEIPFCYVENISSRLSKKECVPYTINVTKTVTLFSVSDIVTNN